MRFKCLYVAVSLVFSSGIFCEKLSDKLNNSTVEYNPEALLIKIFNLNGTIQSRAKFNFEENDRDLYFNSSKMISTVNDNMLLNTNEDKQEISFIEDNRVGKVKKRRRRKPRVQGPQGLTPGYYGPYAPYVQPPGIEGSQFYGQDPSGIYNPPNRQRPSLATEALSTVSEALTSIALFDDRECVARLLCEAASGAPGSGTLQSIAGLQPLLTLLSAYRGISSNPLFVFGRAAFLGMSSKNNPSSCRVAYPLCPTDPEQLVYYLNNHNGGFFRFFNAPQNNQNNINQFYSQLSQNYNNQQNQFPQNVIGNNYPYQSNQQNQINGYPVQKYGNNYPYNKNNDGLNKIRFKNLEENTIEERIQNRPGKYLDDFEDNLSFENIDNTKWSFPDDINTKVRVGKGLKFPDESYSDKDIREVNREESKRDPRGFKFPDTRNIEYVNKYQELGSNYNYNSFNNLNSDIYKGYSNNYNEHKEDQSVRTVYVVRGNGDPNHPEIIKLRPGQTIY